MKKLKLTILTLTMMILTQISVFALERLPIKIEKHAEGAPITLGIPIPIGSLYNPDQVRLLNKQGTEIPSQITEVSTWAPADKSIKWIWVFFFADANDQYTLEYGKEVVRTPYNGDRVIIRNVQPLGAYTEVSTGPLNFKVKKDLGGFFETVKLRKGNKPFTDKDIIAEGDKGRGSFLDLIDAAGIDKSKANITRSVIEKGSGPLHGIIRLEGTYTYDRADNNPSPFVIRIHVYAGKSYVKVLHTLTYTGVPDMHKQQEGQHARLAMSGGKLINEFDKTDLGWTQPNDQISAVGFNLKYKLNGKINYKVGYKDGKWWENPEEKVYEFTGNGKENTSMFQTGPNPSKIAPEIESGDKKRIEGFSANLNIDKKQAIKTAKASGWVDMSDSKWGIAFGIKNFFEEYPKEINIIGNENLATAYLWSPKATPMSFAKDKNSDDDGILGNFAQGLAKTSELVYYFREADQNTNQVKKVLNYFLDAPVAHAAPEVYANSKAFGSFSPRGNDHQSFERGLDYKFDWVLFNQNWAPWYGMFIYGDFKNYYDYNKWTMWANNEPGQDYMLWLQFMRTGDPKFFEAAQATSRHTMDVDNIHWPKKPVYIGDTNDALDYFKIKEAPDNTNPFVGVGKRHGDQQWSAILSAHVWVMGWLADYYLAADHRGLEMAKQTADSYLREIWGEHDYRGRRLYLSVWNMTEVFDATKEEKYFVDLKKRVKTMIELQNGTEQNNSLVIDRYGYSQVYASQGLSKYYQISKDESVKDALIKHARSVRDNEPVTYYYESYLSSIHSLLVGYNFTKDKSFLDRALERAEILKTSESKVKFDNNATQAELANVLLKTSQFPQDPEKEYAEWDIRNALRVFGWTHIYNVPYLLDILRNEKIDSNKAVQKRDVTVY